MPRGPPASCRGRLVASSGLSWIQPYPNLDQPDISPSSIDVQLFTASSTRWSGALTDSELPWAALERTSTSSSSTKAKRTTATPRYSAIPSFLLI